MLEDHLFKISPTEKIMKTHSAQDVILNVMNRNFFDFYSWWYLWCHSLLQMLIWLMFYYWGHFKYIHKDHNPCVRENFAQPLFVLD